MKTSLSRKTVPGGSGVLAKKTGVDFKMPLMGLPFHIIEKYRDMAPEGNLLPKYRTREEGGISAAL